MRLLWLSVNASYSHASLALPLLERACRHLSEWEWRQLDLTLSENAEESAFRLYEQRPDFVCATLYLFNRTLTLDILHRLHLMLPTCRIAVGGPECLGDGAAELLQSCSFLSACARGEGEEIMPALLAACATGTEPPAVTGLVYRAADGSLRNLDTPTAVCLDWETFPPPSESPFFPFDKPFAQLETSRGCPHGCSYCTSCRTPVRQKNRDVVRRELECLRARGIRNIRLLDRTFNLPQARAASLVQMFRQEFSDLRFHLEIHPQHLGPALQRELSAAPAGQLHVEAGIQSLQDDVQVAIGRRADSALVLDGLAFLCSLHNLEVHTDLLAGLPEQTLAGLENDLTTLLTYKPAEIQLEILKILPGTPLRYQASARGLVFTSHPPYDVLCTPTLSPSEIATARQLSRLLDLYGNHPALHEAFLAAHHEDTDFVHNFLEYHRSQAIDLQIPSSLKRRFHHFADFSRERHLLSLDVLSYHWLKNGFPAEGCPNRKARYTTEKISGLELCDGNPTALTHPDSRCCLLCGDSGDHLFVFNRALAMNASAAIYRIRR